MKNIKRIVISLFLIMILTTSSYEECYAYAATITIGGGAIATGGLASLAGLTGPLVVIVFAGAMAAGMNVELTRASQDAGMTKTQFVKSKINEFCNEMNTTIDVFSNAILSGATVLNDGRIKITHQASEQLKTFYNWLFNSNQVSSPSSSGSNDVTIQLGNMRCPVITQGQDILIGISSSNLDRRLYIDVGDFPIAIFIAGEEGSLTNRPILITKVNDAITYRITTVNSGNAISNSGNSYNGYNFYVLSSFYCAQWNEKIPKLTTTSLYNDIRAFIDTLDGTFNPSMDAPVSNDSFTGTRDDYNTRSGAYDPANDQSTVINPGLTGGISVPDAGNIAINVRDYLDAIEKALDNIQNITIPAVDTDDDTPVELEHDSSIDPTAEVEEDSNLPAENEQTPIVDPNTPASGSLALEPFKMQLKTLFPFCIPFDVKDMLELLKTDPVAPSYTVNWNIPFINTALNFTVDLSPFNSVAAICRKMELLAFIIALAVVTRSLFIRG